MDSKKKSRINKIVWPLYATASLLLGCFISCRIFSSFVYKVVYVTGTSMVPTLNNTAGRSDVGLVDKSDSAIKGLKRFDIIITYYPWRDYVNEDHYVPGNALKENAPYKVKRLIGLPGETVTINRDLSINIQTNDGKELFFDCDETTATYTENLRLPYKRKTVNGGRINDRAKTYTLEANRYLVMGDNWDDSDDCTSIGSNQEPIYRENLVGKLTCIIGTCIPSSSGSEDVSDIRYSTPKPVR